MENKYLYIDDDNHENAVEKIDGFLSENLKIDTVQCIFRRIPVQHFR